MRRAATIGIVFLGVLSSGCSSWRKSPEKSTAQMLTPEMVSDLSSSGPMSLQNARLILDNQEAFNSKLEMIRNAESEIRLAYYKYNDDQVGSAFTNELLTVSHERNLKVKILVDFWNNYERLDFFSYLQKAGEGRIEVRFYGIPSDSVLRGALYETSNCGPANSAAAATCVFPSATTWFSKLYLTGLYSRNLPLMNLAKQLSKLYTKVPETKQVTELAEQILSMDFSEAVDDESSLSLALQTQNTPLGPWIESTLKAPLFSPEDRPFLDHVSDSARQRLLVVDGFKFQVGGRDLENQNGTLNTDFYAESAATLNIQAAFDRLFGFSPMVGDVALAQSLAPNEYMMNPVPFQKSLALCMLANKTTAHDLESCVNSNLSHLAEYESAEDRMIAVENDLKESAKQPLKNISSSAEKPWKPNGDQIDSADLATLKAFYIENLTFTKKDPSQRLFEPESDVASENGKYIHSLWAKALENTCAVAQESKTRKRVILHSESLFLPANILQTLGKMMSGEWNCKNVDIALITNPTDVENPVPSDIFSRFQLQNLLRFQRSHPGQARLQFYEQRSASSTGKTLFQSKLALLGDDLLVGSADATVRSYTLDTHGAMFLRNALQATQAYANYVDGLIASGQLVNLTDYYTSASNADLQEESRSALKTLIPNWQDNLQLSTAFGDVVKELKSMTAQILKPLRQETSESPHQTRSPAAETATNLAEVRQGYDKLWKSF
jgi:hypothetical protein